jgi:hypothetical protein
VRAIHVVLREREAVAEAVVHVRLATQAAA